MVKTPTMTGELSHILLRVAEAYAEGRGGIALSTVSREVNSSPNLFGRIKKGELVDFKVSSYDMLMQTFSDQWPEEAVWPPGIGRPPPRKPARRS